MRQDAAAVHARPPHPEGPPVGDAASIEAWLGEIGLAEYAAAFRDNNIDAEVLPLLTADDLRELGVASVGHRRRIMAAAAAPKPPEQAERRVLTLMFCDLVDSTGLATVSDPEDYAELVARLRHGFEAAIRPLGGTVERFLGDGVMARFGYPAASEHDAESAVTAALDVIGRVKAMPPYAGRRIEVRVGIATGLTVIGGSDGSVLNSDGALGGTPNLAARLQAMARPNTLLISDRTRSLVGEVFACRDLGLTALRGVAEPTRVWQVEGRSSRASRFDALRAGRLATGFVGRAAERAMLAAAIEEARRGTGGVVAVIGDAGIGKSRLVRHVLAEHGLQAESLPLLQGSPYHQGAPFQPFRTYIGRVCGIRLHDDAAAVATRIARFLEAIGLNSAENRRLLVWLFRDDLDAGLADIGPGEVRARIIGLLEAVLLVRSGAEGVVLVEDAQWLDPSSATLLRRFAPGFAARGGLLLATARSQGADLPSEGVASRTIRLDRLAPDEVAALVATMAGGDGVPAELAATIAGRSDGVPLFAEELTRGYLEARRAGGHAAPQVPMSLVESIQARLDRLSHGRGIASVAAAIGREMPLALLIAASGLAPATARSGIDDLVAAEVLDPSHGQFGDGVRFRHHLVRDAAYELLLRRSRGELHARIADIVEDRFPELARALPHVLAIQRAEAGQFDRAAALWRQAGTEALRRSAYAEAAGFLREAAAALDRTPAGRARDEAEIELRLSLLSALVCAEGYRAEAAAEETDKVVALGQRLGAGARLIPAMQARWVQLASGNLVRAARTFALQARDMTADGPEVERMIAHRMCGTSLLFAGELAPALAEYHAFMRLFDPERHGDALRAGHSDHATMVMLGLAEAHLLVGDAATAETWRARALAAARAAARVHDEGHTLVFAGCLHPYLAGRHDEVAAHAEELAALIARRDLPNWRPFSDLFTGLLRARNGDADAGLAIAGRGAQGLVAAKAWGSWWRLLHAEACLDAGRPAEAAASLAPVRAMLELGAAQFAAEYHRLQARLALGRGDAAAAAAILDEARDTARRQGATLFLDRIEADADALGARRRPG